MNGAGKGIKSNVTQKRGSAMEGKEGEGDSGVRRRGGELYAIPGSLESLKERGGGRR